MHKVIKLDKSTIIGDYRNLREYLHEEMDYLIKTKDTEQANQFLNAIQELDMMATKEDDTLYKIEECPMSHTGMSINILH